MTNRRPDWDSIDWRPKKSPNNSNNNSAPDSFVDATTKHPAIRAASIGKSGTGNTSKSKSSNRGRRSSVWSSKVATTTSGVAMMETVRRTIDAVTIAVEIILPIAAIATVTETTIDAKILLVLLLITATTICNLRNAEIISSSSSSK